MSMRKTCVVLCDPWGWGGECACVSVCETLGRCKPRYCNAIPHAMRWEILLSGKPEMGISSESHLANPPGVANL